jgi:hypothetical protein
MLLRRIRQLTNVAAQNQIKQNPWRSLIVLDGLEGELVENLATSQHLQITQNSIFQDMVLVPSSISILIEASTMRDASPTALSLTRVINIHVDTFSGVEEVLQNLINSWARKAVTELNYGPIYAKALKCLLEIGKGSINVRDDDGFGSSSSSSSSSSSNNMNAATVPMMVSRMCTTLSLLERCLESVDMFGTSKDDDNTNSSTTSTTTSTRQLSQTFNQYNIYKSNPFLQLFPHLDVSSVTQAQSVILTKVFLSYIFAYTWGFGGEPAKRASFEEDEK